MGQRRGEVQKLEYRCSNLGKKAKKPWITFAKMSDKDESCLEGEKSENESMRDVLKERKKKKRPGDR